METRFRGCSSAGGSAEAPPSLWGVLVAMAAAAAAGGGEVEAPRSACVSEMAAALKALGYRVERVSSTRVSIEEVEGSGQGGSVTVRCGMLVPALAAPLAAARLAPRARLVLRPGGSFIQTQAKAIADAVTGLGARAWPGEAGALLVVEGSLSPPRRLLRLYTPWAPLAAGIVIAGSVLGVGEVRIIGKVKAAGMLDEAIRIAGITGIGVEAAEQSLRPRLRGETTTGPLRAPPSPYTIALAALPLLTCGDGWEAALEAVPPALAEEAASLLRAMGLGAEPDCGAEDCRILLHPGKPRSMLHQASDHSDHVLAALAHAGLSRSPVSGASVLEDEGYSITALEKRGLASIQGDLVKPESGAPPSTLECSPEVRHVCVYAAGAMLASARGVLAGSERLWDRLPGVAETWTMLSDAVEHV